MRKINAALVALIMLALPFAIAQQNESKPSVTPDSFIWGLKVAVDNLNLLLTFNPKDKARKGIEIARERLEEVKAMAEENKLDAAEKAKEEEIKTLSKVKASISSIKDSNATKQIEDEIELEKELDRHEDEVKDVSDNLRIKVEVKGALNEEQKALLDSLLSSLENKTGEVKVEIQNKKDETKIRMRQEGKSEKDVEDKIQDIEEEQGLADAKREKAVEEVKDAKSDLEDLEKKLQEYNATSEASATSLIDNAKEKLSNAEKALNDTKYGEAFGQANAARRLIKNAERILGKASEKGKNHETEGQEIKVEIENNEARVKVEIGNDELRFTLNTTDKDAIIKEISERTGLSIDDVAKITEFEGYNEHKEGAAEKEEPEANETETGKGRGGGKETHAEGTGENAAAGKEKRDNKEGADESSKEK